MTTLYYDPILDIKHELPVAANLTTAFYAAPQAPNDARRLLEAGYSGLKVGESPKLPSRRARSLASSLFLAREWELSELETPLAAAIERSYQPTWNDEVAEFTWGLGLDEVHPRGQFNAFLAAAEAVGPGMWSQLSAAPLEACPKVVDVDFPTLALSRAEWIGGCLNIRLAPIREDAAVRTTFRIVGAEPRQWDLTGIDGATMETTMHGVIVRVPLVHGDLEFTPGSY